jgi:hypothetical protein
MRSFIISLGLGTATESLFAFAIYKGGFGPCGPASLWSAIPFYLHLPGLFAVMPLHYLNAPDSVLWGILGILYIAIWSVLWYLTFTRRFIKTGFRKD